MYYRSRRIPADLRATVTILGLKRTVRVLNVSEIGMEITLGSRFDPGTPLTFQGVRTNLSGMIRWSDGKKAGILLDGELSQGEITELAGMVWTV